MLARAAAPLLLALALTGCGGSGEPAESTPRAAEDAATAKQIHAQRGERVDDADDRVEELHRGVHPRRDLRAGAEGRRLQDPQAARLGSEKVAFAAVKAGKVDAYPEYTGTALTTFFGVDGRHPQGRAAGLRPGEGELRQGGALTALPPTPFTDSNAVGMTQARAQELGIKTISDLKSKASRLTLSGSKECRTAHGLQARARARLRAEVQALSRDRARRPPRRAHRGAAPTSRSSSPPTGRSPPTTCSCSRTTASCSRPTTSR